jgi:hypothetical protein
MNNKNRSVKLSKNAQAVADMFNRGFEEIIKKPEWAEYFYQIIPGNKGRVREEMLVFVIHALTVLLRMNGYIRELEDIETFMEEFVGRVGGWDNSLFKTIEEYRAIDKERGDALSSASQIQFAKRLSSVLLGSGSEDGEVLLGLSDLGVLFLMNFITPTLTEVFYN